MNVPLRQWLDRLFTVLAILSVVLIVAALVGILLPMMWRGGGAVVFRGTVEFRKMQLEKHGRGDKAAMLAEIERTGQVRKRAYEILDEFSAGIDTSELGARVRQIHREFCVQMEARDPPGEQTARLRSLSKELRDDLQQAFETNDKPQAIKFLDAVASHADDAGLKGTPATGFFDIARRYRGTVDHFDLGRREEYRKQYALALTEVKDGMFDLFGPRPGEPQPGVAMRQYGATRWDQALKLLDSLLWAEQWVSGGQGQALSKVRTPREEQFAGTELAGLFPFVKDNAGAMLGPQWTFYWQYFVDDSTPGHYFGGVGPEILGTLLVTVLAILVALPIGVVAAAYLVECAGDSFVTRSLRTCINTLAGVPSIVFGLFGLAFFVVWFLPGGPIVKIGEFSLRWPGFGMDKFPSIIAGSLTLALLVLPVIIRASEEAIRTVPRAYKEASLALGASGFRCFVTVTLPAALPGILTGLILSMSRAAGETAPILFTCAVAMGPVPGSLTQQTRTLSYSSYDMAVGDKTAALAPHNQFGMVMTLVAIVLVLNLTAIIVRGKLSKKLRGQ
jgi:phosphate transport system permease protein